jgi:signal transduction histidine kinase
MARGRLGAGVGMEPGLVLDLGHAFRLVVQELRDSHPNRALAQTIQVEGPVYSDSTRVQQLLSNLVANALVHGAHDRPVSVNVSMHAGWLTVCVHNHGTPIPRESPARVFEPYWRPAGADLSGGLGLGLYICSQIVKGHGGTLDVSSSWADGTTFSARIPITA